MRELDCDFCGAAAAGAYEVGPAPPNRSPTDRRRLVLCGDCRETLSTAVAPLLERLRAAESGDGRATAADVRDVATGEERASTAAGQDADGLEPAGTTASEPAPNGAATDDADGVTDATGGRADDDAGGVTAPTGGTDETAETDSETAETDSETAETGTETAETGTETAETGTETAETGTETADGADAGEEPPQFRKVMRLLNNRSFPVDRSEFVDMAAGAYDVDAAVVEESLAYAVERGVLAAEDGQIVRG